MTYPYDCFHCEQIIQKPVGLHEIRKLRKKVLSPRTQRFHAGDIVQLANKFRQSMSHFTGQGGFAIVMYSYEDRYDGKGSEEEYCLTLQSGECVSWYPADVMTLVERAK